MSSSMSSSSSLQSTSSCSTKLSTLVRKINLVSTNRKNATIIQEFHKYMQEKASSENHQVNNLKVVMDFARFLGPINFYDIQKREQIISFLNGKIKTQVEDPDKKWITTWNHYLNRIKLFLRWLYNYNLQHEQDLQEKEEWITPDFCKIKPKQTKRISPYLESEIWERDELLTLIKYELYSRNKAILSLLWDLDARPHEITLLRIKHIRLREKYGEGEIPHEAKTGTGPLLLTLSFPFVRDWINEHPFKNEPNATLMCNLHNGAPIKPKAIWNIMNQLKNRIIRLLETKEITDKEREKLEFLIKTKKWNPYCIRHSAITADSDYLPEYALKKKVRWSMNSKQGSRYIKSRMGNDLKQKILTYNGIVPPEEMKKKPSVLECPRCELVNTIENKYCSKCSYPLVPSAFEEIKMAEELKVNNLEEKYKRDMKEIREEINHKLSQVMLMIQQNPKLIHAKPEALLKIENATS
jgi:integrase/recombinase XerD